MPTLSATSTAGIVLLCVAIVVIIVVVVCSAVYMSYLNRQDKILQPVRAGGPRLQAHPFRADPGSFVNPTSVSFSRVPFHMLPAGISRSIIHDKDPGLDLLQGFLTPDECRHLINLAEGRFQRSSVVDPTTGKNIEDKDRTSRSVYLNHGEDDIVQRIEQRAALALGVPLENFERLQVVKYEPGQFYKAHHDYLDAAVPELKTAGQRVGTIFAYLNDLPDDEPGGGTKFHTINKTVKPQLGSAALWYNMVKDPTSTVPKVDPTTLHSGEPVLKSKKYGLNVWARTLPQRNPK